MGEHVAAERGIALEAVKEESPPEGLYGDIVGLRVTFASGASHRVLGTRYADRVPRIVRIDGFSMDIVAESGSDFVVIENRDKPGNIGFVGQVFGELGINIADMSIGTGHDGKALMVTRVEGPVTSAVKTQLKTRDDILFVRMVKMPTYTVD
eukprot:NODE_5187_length_708_cov_31.752656_g4819_i0.p1 GENE.NODE_5187_length_708_cov_31.752656_g4819_i0~~NODE_5187_length_708_cov_31.752656_g4819_i0.p1  ORF type:complete len:152 (-),score=24.88 NODE_5187_length_708_cov_31.752656_g4819_i0:224-679(-)